MTGIIIKNLSKSFGPKTVLENIDLEIKEKESLVIIGGSGSGKSVFIKCMFGIMAPDSGSVSYWGDEFYSAPAEKKKDIISKIGVLFQGGALFDSLKIWQNISFSLIHNFKYDNDRAKEVAIEKLSMVGLSKDVADLYPSELSGGMQKRAGLARAIATNPKVIFFDEPTSGLDPINTEVINDLIKKCSHELGATTVTITHDMKSANKISDRVAMLYKGKLIWIGNHNDLMNSGNEFVHQFINGNTDGPIKIES